jgi:hypothetical protein
MRVNYFKLILAFAAFTAICGLSEAAFREITYASTNSTPGPIPDRINDIILKTTELPPTAIFKRQLIMKDLITAGWLTSSSPNNEIVQGLVHTWAVDDRIVSIKYGYFDTKSKAQTAVLNAIRYKDPFLHPNPVSGSFSGISIGENCYRWELSLDSSERAQKIASREDIAILGFVKGRFALVITGSSNGLQIQKNILENLAVFCETKVEIAESLDGFDSTLPALIPNKGIRNSLQVKLDHFMKDYRQGNYKVSLNMINAFLNELNAQRGKHVSESAYQTLKGYADTIVQSLNALM